MYSSTLTYNGRFCAEYLNLHVGLRRACGGVGWLGWGGVWGQEGGGVL